MVQPSLEVWRMSEKARMDQNTHTHTDKTTQLSQCAPHLLSPPGYANHALRGGGLTPPLSQWESHCGDGEDALVATGSHMEACIKQLSVLAIFKRSKDQQFLLVDAMFFFSLFLKLLKYIYWFTCFCYLLSPLTGEVKEKCDAQSISRENYFRWHIRKYSRVAEFCFTNAVFSPLIELSIYLLVCLLNHCLVDSRCLINIQWI